MTASDFEVWLRKQGGEPKRISSRRWDFTFANGRLFPAHARAERGWWAIDVPLGPMEPWTSTRWNEGLIDGRLVGARDGVGPTLRVEAPLTSGETPADVLPRVHRGVEASLVAIETDSPPVGWTVPTGHLGPFGARLKAAGWSFREVSGDQLIIDMKTPTRPGRVEARPAGNGFVRVSTTVARADADNALGRWAVARFLLTASARLRRVRPAATDGGSMSLSIDFLEDAGDDEIDAALWALSFANATLGAEAALLAMNEEAAAKYAALFADEFTPTTKE